MKYRKKLIPMLVGANLLSVSLSMMFDTPAYAMPNAGSVAAGVNQDREWKPQAEEDSLQVDLGEVNTQDQNIHIKITDFDVQVDTSTVDTNKLKQIVSKDIKDEMTFADLQQACNKLTQYLHGEGYMTAIAYLPTQEIINGVVQIDVLIGHYDNTTYDNTSQLCTRRADGFTHPSREGKIIRRQSMDKLLLIMNDIPGVKAHAFLSPGSKDGTAAVNYKLTTTETDGGYAFIDNYGSRFTGRWRFGGNYYWNNISHVGDQIQLSYLQSFGGYIHNYNARYQIPVGNFGTFAGVEFFRTDYNLKEEYTPLNASGTSHGWRLYTRSSLKRTLNNNWYFLTEVSRSNLSDRIKLFETDSQKHGTAFRFGFDGDNRNAHSASTYKLMHSIGHLTMDSAYAQSGDLYGTEGTWQKTNLDVYHIERLAPRWELHSSLSAQYPWTNLDSSEKIYIGGYNAVRAFPQGETGGDKGVYGTLEFRYQTGDPHWQLAAFYDAGWIGYNHHSPYAEAQETRTLQGVGIGAIWNDTGSSYGRIDIAFPVGNRYSKSYSENIGATIWCRYIHRL